MEKTFFVIFLESVLEMNLGRGMLFFSGFYLVFLPLVPSSLFCLTLSHIQETDANQSKHMYVKTTSVKIILTMSRLMSRLVSRLVFCQNNLDINIFESMKD